MKEDKIVDALGKDELHEILNLQRCEFKEMNKNLYLIYDALCDIASVVESKE